jgi:arylsulfatase A-like enzyme
VRRWTREVWTALAALALAAAGAAAQPAPPRAAPRPNIVFILADDLGYGDLGVYGQRIIQTPNLDRLAAEGVRFTQFYAGSTVCAPSRSVLMTGRHMGHTRVRGNAGAGDYAAQTLAAGDVTVARVLQQAGYATALIGKWGLGEMGSEGEPNRHGFDEFYGVVNQTHAHNHYPDFLWRNREKVALRNVVTPVGAVPGAGYATARAEYANDLFFDEARAFIGRSKDRPFFLFLSLTVPHANNERARALGDGQEVPDYGPYAGQAWAEPLKGQAAMITRMDRHVGELLAQLKRLGIDERTLVIFTSDNGPHKEGGPAYDPDFFDANGPFSGIKRSLTDGGIRVPFIARWPGAITSGGVSPHVSYFGDVFATLAELAGGTAPAGLDGLSLVPTLLGRGTQATHPYLYWEFYEGGFSQAVLLDGRWKGIRLKSPAAPIQLYDLAHDPAEQTDRAGREPALVDRIRSTMRDAHVDNEYWKWPAERAAAAPAPRSDILVYGCTAGGITAAIQAKRMGKAVVMVCPERHLGGLTAGGLGWTDSGNKAVIGGLSREFYHRVWQHYQKPEAWRWQKREDYGNKGQGTAALDQAAGTMWIFEPHVAEGVFEAWVAELKIPVVRDAWLDRDKGVRKDGDRIASISTLDGRTYTAQIFIDATYEGDLMAAAGVDYHVGRESMKTYGEQWAGVQTGVLHHRHHFGVLKAPVSPYVVPGNPSSGLLPRISADPPGAFGEGDTKVQAYCFRLCLTQVPANRVPFPRPATYDPGQYELLLRIFDAGWRETFDKFDPIPNSKTDTNNHGPFSTDNIGRNWDYPEASYERRREIVQEHVDYQQGWLYFIANDPRVPEDVRAAMSAWGLARDEFVDNGHWPHQIYVREARRMVGRHVMTEHELLKRRPTPESVGMGSYGIDSHNIQRYVTPDGYVQNEGDIGVSTDGPYQISYGSLVPKRGQAANLLVPVAVSSSHVAYGSIRMEPVFMVLGQSAATAAALAIDGGLAVQEVPYERLRARLLADGQVLDYAGGSPPR